VNLDVDPDPTFHPDADLDPDPGFKKRIKPLEKCSNRLIFHTFWLDMCKFMRIQIQLINFDADPDADLDPDFNLMRMLIPMWSQVTIMMWIFAELYPDPQHCCIQIQ
jgi:hypothetical protein